MRTLWIFVVAFGCCALVWHMYERLERFQAQCLNGGGVRAVMGVCWSADGRRIDLSSEQPPV